ncbi:phenol hydroxylase P5 protein [Oxobacter pfennigii]|uniref:Phenol hydroxylase P5 protein n=1 Tax=Oxobacter pfennigii TaxID=36849 RepID=A0A0P8YV32_9CLOT|nr:4Fe-4S binding protein [Oxobacter pfennigii]KPU43566.1 phenol hydroxylase P5 protein [Oxobacter pfennigii]
MESLNNYFIKTNRTFTPMRKYAWVFTLLVAIGGLWEPKLGLLVLLVIAGLLTTSFFTGRYWCGNICPHGSLFDKLMMPISRNVKIPKFIKSKIFITLFFLFFMFNLSRKILKALAFWGTFDFLDKLGFIFANTYLVVLIAGGTLAILFAPRTWCQFCPMGTMEKLSHKLGKKIGITKKTEKKITISSTEKCHACGKCSRVCPFQLTPYLEFSDNNQFDNINCIKCSTCVENCPAGILSLEYERDAIKLKEKTSISGYENKQKIRAKISDIKDLAEDVKEYTFTFLSPEIVDYKSGQFILVKIQDEPKAYRAYSISSYNVDGTKLSVIIKKVQNGYGTGKIFEEFKIGDMVELEGPMGDELVLKPAVKKAVFIGNGIGITPFIALTKDILLNYPEVSEVKLLNGQRYEEEFLYHDYFKALDEQYEKFEYIPVVSRDKNSGYRKGHVTDILKDMDLAGYQAYMCGSKNMVKDSINILIDKGVKEEDIFYESE